MANMKQRALFVMKELGECVKSTDILSIRTDILCDNFIIELSDELGNWYASRVIPFIVFLSDERLKEYIKERKEENK